MRALFSNKEIDLNQVLHLFLSPQLPLFAEVSRTDILILVDISYPAKQSGQLLESVEILLNHISCLISLHKFVALWEFLVTKIEL